MIALSRFLDCSGNINNTHYLRCQYTDWQLSDLSDMCL